MCRGRQHSCPSVRQERTGSPCGWWPRTLQGRCQVSSATRSDGPGKRHSDEDAERGSRRVLKIKRSQEKNDGNIQLQS